MDKKLTAETTMGRPVSRSQKLWKLIRFSRTLKVLIMLLLSLALWQFINISVPIYWQLGQMVKDRRSGTNRSTVLQACSQGQRFQTLTKVCQKHRLKEPDMRSALDNLMVDMSHKVMYCNIAGSNSDMFMDLIHYAVTGKKMPLKYNHEERVAALTKAAVLPLATYRTQLREDILRDFYKVLAVSHPLDRLIQTWESYFLRTGRYADLRHHAKKAIEMFRGLHKDYDYNEILKGATLEEFLKYLTYLENKGNEKHDAHWETYSRLCQPCVIKYDLILKLETLSEDKTFLNKRLNLTLHLNPETLRPKHHTVKISSRLESYKILSSSVLHPIMQLYESDMESFGYTWNEQTLTAECNNPEHNCC